MMTWVHAAHRFSPVLNLLVALVLHGFSHGATVFSVRSNDEKAKKTDCDNLVVY